jgi:hypothetical protein
VEGLVKKAQNLIVDDWFNKRAKGGLKSL